MDAKWIVGLALVALLSVSLVIRGSEQLTAPPRAVDTLTLGIALYFSPSGLDDPVDLATLRSAVAAAPGHTLRPLKGLNITVSESDLQGTPREVRLRLFRQLAEALYERGPEGLASLATDPQTENSLSHLGPLGLFTRNTHDLLLRILAILAMALLILFALLVVFSHRFGRLLSPGIVLLVAAGPLALLLTAGRAYLEAMQGTVPPALRQGTGDAYGYFAHSLGPLVLAPFLPAYQLVATLGLFLAVAAFLGWLGSVVFRRPRQTSTKELKLAS